MTYREIGGEADIPCARCGTAIVPSTASFADDGRRLCTTCDRQLGVVRSELEVARQVQEAARSEFMARHFRLIVAGGLFLLGGIVWTMVTVLEPVTRRIKGRDPVPTVASITALPYPEGLRVDVRALPHSAVEVLGHRAEVSDERVAQVVILRAEAEGIHEPEIPVNCAPSPHDSEAYRPERLMVTVPRLSARPVP